MDARGVEPQFTKPKLWSPSNGKSAPFLRKILDVFAVGQRPTHRLPWRGFIRITPQWSVNNHRLDVLGSTVLFSTLMRKTSPHVHASSELVQVEGEWFECHQLRVYASLGRTFLAPIVRSQTSCSSATPTSVHVTSPNSRVIF